MNGEIGSEFWLEGEPAAAEALPGDGRQYVLSGRTGLDLVVRDIVRRRRVRGVYMPAWCCGSMVEPFRRHGIRVEFYDVAVGDTLEYRIDTDHETDILYVTNYFGYGTTLPLGVVEAFRSRGAVILYDRTHSMLRAEEASWADYTVASIRKWMGVVCGAEVTGLGPVELGECPYLDTKLRAMEAKRRYMDGNAAEDKGRFLADFADFGHRLDEDYAGYGMDPLSRRIYAATDLEAVRQRRRANAGALHRGLPLRFLSPLGEGDVPLFVPVLFENKEQRDRVRQHLIDHRIYCPVHWPRPEGVPEGFEANNIYDTGLSLVCDQRYTVQDMHRMVETVEEAIKRSNNQVFKQSSNK